MKKVTYLVCCVGLALQSCQSGQVKNENPFFNTYETPHEVPPFHLIKNQHYLPAYEEGMKQHQAEIDAIINNPDAPTFKNTIDALETSGELLNKVASVFGNQQGANTNDSIKAIAKEITPKLTAHWDAINLNDKLFERIKTVYNNKEKENLTPEQLTVLDKYYQGFVRGGANLSPEDKETFKKLNSELSMLSLQFGENLLNETNRFKLIIDNEKDLSGLPENVIATAATAAQNAGLEGKWVFTLHNPSMIPFLQYADNRDLREKIYKAYINRCNNDNEFDNKEIISKITSLRVQKAQLLGYDTHAAFILDNNMAKTPENVYNLCNQIWNAALPIAKKEAKELKKLQVFSEDNDFLKQLLQIKQNNKDSLAQYLLHTQGIRLNTDAVFDIQIKRLHEYKRQQLNALELIYRYLEIKRGTLPAVPVVALFGAKAAPAYTIAKDIIHLILCLQQVVNQDPQAAPWLQIAMIENYNITSAEKLIPACDISEQLSLASKEASGTGNMKFMLNGAITLGTLDGANVEIAQLVGSKNVYTFGADSQTVIRRYEDKSYHPEEYYESDPIIREVIDFITGKEMMKIGCRENLLRLSRELRTKDWFMTLPDFADYSSTRQRAYHDYRNRRAWAQKMLVNISNSGFFSSDRTVSEYNRDIWHA